MAMEAGSKSRILVIGATGTLGRELVRASLAAGHPTFALVREPAFSDPQKSLLRSFAADGVTLLKDLPDIPHGVESTDLLHRRRLATLTFFTTPLNAPFLRRDSPTPTLPSSSSPSHRTPLTSRTASGAPTSSHPCHSSSPSPTLPSACGCTSNEPSLACRRSASSSLILSLAGLMTPLQVWDPMAGVRWDGKLRHANKPPSVRTQGTR